MGVEMIYISRKEYEQLLDDAQMLEFLTICGVDNWEGYDDALSMYEQWESSNE